MERLVCLALTSGLASASSLRIIVWLQMFGPDSRSVMLSSDLVGAAVGVADLLAVSERAALAASAFF